MLRQEDRSSVVSCLHPEATATTAVDVRVSESDDALAKAFASIAAVGERVGSGTLGAYEVQVFIKRNFGHSDPMLFKAMMGAADTESENGAPPPAVPHAHVHVLSMRPSGRTVVVVARPDALCGVSDPCALSLRRD